jgi:hypothetical protein
MDGPFLPNERPDRPANQYAFARGYSREALHANSSSENAVAFCLLLTVSALTFRAGLVPLVTITGATGYGATAFGGSFLIPVLYVVAQRMRERIRGKRVAELPPKVSFSNNIIGSTLGNGLSRPATKTGKDVKGSRTPAVARW